MYIVQSRTAHSARAACRVRCGIPASAPGCYRARLLRAPRDALCKVGSAGLRMTVPYLCVRQTVGSTRCPERRSVLSPCKARTASGLNAQGPLLRASCVRHAVGTPEDAVSRRGSVLPSWPMRYAGRRPAACELRGIRCLDRIIKFAEPAYLDCGVRSARAVPTVITIMQRAGSKHAARRSHTRGTVRRASANGQPAVNRAGTNTQQLHAKHTPAPPKGAYLRGVVLQSGVCARPHPAKRNIK